MNKKNYESALKAVTKALEKDSTQVKYYLLKAVALEDLEKYPEALAVFSDAIRVDASSPEVYFGRGDIYLKGELFDLAIKDYSSALQYCETDSLKVVALNNRAAAILSQREFKGAYVDLNRAYALDSTSLITLINLGMVCDEVGKGDETIFYLLKAVEIDSTFFGAYTNLGFKYQDMKEFEKSISYFDKALACNPKDFFSLNNRGYSKLKLGDLKGQCH